LFVYFETDPKKISFVQNFMIMSTFKLKVDLLDIISREENYEKLMLLNAFVHRYLLDDKMDFETPDAYENFEEPEWLTERLRTMVEDYKQGKLKVVANEDFWSRLNKKYYANNMVTGG
jgi:hypothetical protein